jgi:iron complex transport system substrate-binding protein
MGRSRSISLAVVLAVVVAACGSDPGDGASPGDGVAPARFPVTVHGTNGPVTIDARPQRIVSLSPTATEDLFAIGAGDQVIAVDDQSNFPPEAPRTDLSGIEPNVEAIAGYEPDLVVFATETGDLGASFETLGITALQLDAPLGLEDVYHQIEQLGLATGHPQEAETVVSRMRDDIEQIVDGVDPAAGLTYYFELDDTYYSVTSQTFIGSLFRMLGLENIADAVGKGSGGYPQLSAEYIVDADPDLIFLADTKCCGQSPETVAARPGWGGIAAVRGGGVVPLDDDVASRWGPRLVDLLRQAADGAVAVGAEAA